MIKKEIEITLTTLSRFLLFRYWARVFVKEVHISYFKKESLISTVQFGLRKRCSTFETLVKLIENIFNDFDKSKSVLATMCDLIKAHDRDSPRILITN